MPRYQIELATEKDDADLREILRKTPMEGHISVSFRREPSYFDAAVVEGDFRQVVAARDQETQRLVGFGARSVRQLLVNCVEQPVGYLSTLRLLKEHRNLGLIAKGYAKFRELHEDGRAPYYLTTIAEGNETALKILTSGRAGLPTYRYLQTLYALAIPLKPAQSKAHFESRASAIQVEPMSESDLYGLIQFWRMHGAGRQFFPALRQNDFFDRNAIYRDLNAESILIARRGGNVVGTLGVWDQSSFKQSVVERYSRGMAMVRPSYNFYASLRGSPPLPPVGEAFSYLTGALVCVVKNDPAIAGALLNAAVQRTNAASKRFLMLGLTESDPLLPMWRRKAAARYATRVYLVAFEKADEYAASLDGRSLYLELGCL